MGTYQSTVDTLLRGLKSNGWDVEAEEGILYVNNPEDSFYKIGINIIEPDSKGIPSKSKLEMKSEIKGIHPYKRVGKISDCLPFKPKRVDVKYIASDFSSYEFPIIHIEPDFDDSIHISEDAIDIYCKYYGGRGGPAGLLGLPFEEMKLIFPDAVNDGHYITIPNTALIPKEVQSLDKEVNIHLACSNADKLYSFGKFVEPVPVIGDWRVQKWMQKKNREGKPILYHDEISVEKKTDAEDTVVKGMHEFMPGDGWVKTTNAYLTTIDRILKDIHESK